MWAQLCLTGTSSGLNGGRTPALVALVWMVQIKLPWLIQALYGQMEFPQTLRYSPQHKRQHCLKHDVIPYFSPPLSSFCSVSVILMSLRGWLLYAFLKLPSRKTHYIGATHVRIRSRGSTLKQVRAGRLYCQRLTQTCSLWLCLDLTSTGLTGNLLFS